MGKKGKKRLDNCIVELKTFMDYLKKINIRIEIDLSLMMHKDLWMNIIGKILY